MENVSKKERMVIHNKDVIQLYSAATPNGMKVAACLEELCELRSHKEDFTYEPHTVDIRTGESRKEGYTSIAPHGKIPAIFDPHGPSGKPIKVFESGAILQYLAEKYHELIASDDPNNRVNTITWCTWGSSALSSQAKAFGFYYKYCPHKLEYCVARYTKEVTRLLRVLEDQLESHGKHWVIGDVYTIADISIWPWIYALHENYDDAATHVFGEFKAYPLLEQWYQRCLSRPATQKALQVTPFTA